MGKLVRERLPNIRISEAAGFTEYVQFNVNRSLNRIAEMLLH